MRGPAAIKHNLPEDAADAEMRAADAFVERANEAVNRQVGRRMPAAHGMFDEEDQRGRRKTRRRRRKTDRRGQAMRSRRGKAMRSRTTRAEEETNAGDRTRRRTRRRRTWRRR